MPFDPKWTPYYHYMRQNGAVSGSVNMNVNGSVTPVDLTWAPSDSGFEYAEIYRMIVYIEDNSAMRVQDFGAINGGLTNGVEIHLVINGVEQDQVGETPIKTNGEWTALCYDGKFISQGAGDDVFVVRWTAAAASGPTTGNGMVIGGAMPICLKKDDQVLIRIADDLTSLVEFRVMIQMRAKVY